MRIVIIDRHPVVRVGVKLILDKYFDIISVSEADQMESFCNSFPSESFDLILLGVEKEIGTDLYSTVRLLKKLQPFSKIVLFNQDESFFTPYHYLKSYVKGYLSKESTEIEIYKCILSVLKGKSYLNNLMKVQKNMLLDKKTDLSEISSKLTASEFAIAKYLARGMRPGNIAQILNRKPSTISAHKSNIFRKMKINSIIHLCEQITIN